MQTMVSGAITLVAPKNTCLQCGYEFNEAGLTQLGLENGCLVENDIATYNCHCGGEVNVALG